MLDLSCALQKPGEAFPFEESVKLEDQDVLGDTVSFDTVTLKGVYSAMGDKVLIEGTLHTVWHATCCRCLEPAEAEITVPFSERFIKQDAQGSDEDFRYEGNSVSLYQPVLTIVMLELPMRFLCRADCPGVSGSETRFSEPAEQSASSGTQTQRPFEALKQFLIKDEEV